MNKQEALVYIFNESIKRNLGLDSVKYYGVCERINTKDKSKLYGDNIGLKEEVFIDDLYENFYFHINNSNTLLNGYDAGFGDSPLISSSNKNTLVYFSSNRENKSDEEIYHSIINAIPVEVLQANRIFLKVQKILVSPTDYNANKEDVFDKYFKDYSNKSLQVGHVLISIDYTIYFEYMFNCVNMCKKEQLVLEKCHAIECLRMYGSADYVTCDYSL